MIPSSLDQLKTWLKDHCYDTSHYSIDGESIYEGYGIDQYGPLYVWYYTERGERQDLDFFRSEKEIIEYAFHQITADKGAQRHLVGFLKTESEAAELIAELNARNIPCERDELLYSNSEPKMRIRVFVNGCDVLRAADLQSRYYQRA